MPMCRVMVAMSSRRRSCAQPPLAAMTKNLYLLPHESSPRGGLQWRSNARRLRSGRGVRDRQPAPGPPGVPRGLRLRREGAPSARRRGSRCARSDLRRLRPQRDDTIIVSGGEESAVAGAARNPALLRWLGRALPVVRRMTSVCSGAFVLASAGMLDGRRATTHWSGCDQLAELFPRGSQVDRNAIFVQDGSVWTSAGVTTGIDMALAMVERDLGRAVADAVAARLVLYVRRPGFQSQFSDALVAQTSSSARFESGHRVGARTPRRGRRRAPGERSRPLVAHPAPPLRRAPRDDAREAARKASRGARTNPPVDQRSASQDAGRPMRLRRHRTDEARVSA